jgi:hypothetical protein
LFPLARISWRLWNPRTNRQDASMRRSFRNHENVLWAIGERATQQMGRSRGIGAAQAHDAALATASAEVKWLNGWSAAATFEGEFSNVTRSYAGKGVVRYAW